MWLKIQRKVYRAHAIGHNSQRNVEYLKVVRVDILQTWAENNQIIIEKKV